MNASGCVESVCRAHKMERLAAISEKVIKRYARLDCSAAVVVFHPNAPDGDCLLHDFTRPTSISRPP